MNSIKSVEEVIVFAESKLSSAPEGVLKIREKNGCNRFYIAPENGAGRERYLGKGNESTVKALQEKHYYTKLKSTAEKELVGLRKIEEIQKGLKTYQEVFFSIPEQKRNMIEPYVAPELEAVKKKIEKEQKYWEKNNYYKKAVPKELNYYTMKGERVRSKSELIIADRLNVAGVPYFYEGKCVIIDDNGQETGWSPDFQMINPRTGELLFWEHFGLMDIPEYCASGQAKLEIYAKNGIIMGKNLIVTMESSQHTLNVSYIDKMIDTFLK